MGLELLEAIQKVTTEISLLSTMREEQLNLSSNLRDINRKNDQRKAAVI